MKTQHLLGTALVAAFLAAGLFSLAGATHASADSGLAAACTAGQPGQPGQPSITGVGGNGGAGGDGGSCFLGLNPAALNLPSLAVTDCSAAATSGQTPDAGSICYQLTSGTTLVLSPTGSVSVLSAAGPLAMPAIAGLSGAGQPGAPGQPGSGAQGANGGNCLFGAGGNGGAGANGS